MSQHGHAAQDRATAGCAVVVVAKIIARATHVTKSHVHADCLAKKHGISNSHAVLVLSKSIIAAKGHRCHVVR